MSHLILFFVFFFSQTFLFSQTTEKTGDLVLVPQTGHTADVNNISISADNKYFLSSSQDDGTVKLWSIDGRLIRVFSSANTGNTYGSIISPDGKFVITKYNGQNFLLDINGKQIKQMYATWGAVSFTKDSKFFIMNSDEYAPEEETESTKKTTIGKRLQMFDVKGKLIRTFSGDMKLIYAVDIASDGKSFVTGADKGKLGIWNINGSLTKTVDAHSDVIYFVKYSPDGTHIITSSYDKKVKLWTADGEFKREVFKSEEGIVALEFAPDGKTFVVSLRNSYAMIMDLNGKKVKQLENAKDPRGVAFSSDGKTILVGEMDGNILIYDGQGNYLRNALKGTNMISYMDYNGDSILINGKKVWDLETESIQDLPQQNKDIIIRKGNFSADNKYILSVQDDGDKVFVYDAKSRKQINKLSIPNYVSISPNNQIFSLETMQPDLQLSLLDMEGNLVQKFKERNVTKADISPDRKYIATFGEKTIKLKETKGKEIFSILTKEEYPDTLKFSSGSKYLFFGTSNSIQVYNLAGKPLFTFPHANTITQVVSSADDKFFLTGSFDTTVKLWDANGKNIKTFQGHPFGVWGLAFSKDGKFVITASSDGVIRFFTIANGALAAQVIFTDYGVVTTAPDGRFDYGDSRAIQYISYRKGGTNEMVSLDQVFQSYYTPDLLKKILNGNISKPTSDINTALKKNLPELKLELGSQNNGKIDLIVEACDKGGGLQNFAIYQNGNLIHEGNYTSPAQKGSCKVGTVTLNLADGQNAFKISAYNSANIKAESPTRAVTYVSPESLKPQLHVLMVAINDYVSASSKLKFAVKDAEGLKESFQKYGKGAFGKVNFYEVYNREAVKSGILNAMKKVKDNARLNDTVVVFFSGHGFTVDGKFFYIPQDITNSSDIEAGSEAEYNQKYKAWEIYVKKGSISSDEISQAITQIKANNKMLIVDSCYSGGGWLSKVNEAKVDQKIEEQRSDIVKKSNLTGIAMISAAQDFQKAHENGEIGNGFLTFGLLEAMKIEKDRGKISAFSVIPQAAKKVRELSKQYKKKQIPFQSTSGVDFELSD